MARFGNDYWADYDSVMTMDREGLIQSLLSISEDNKALKFSREFLEKYPDKKLCHFLWESIKETFYCDWENREKEMMADDDPCGLCP